jgi:peptidyl-dipeptidase Dcp
MEATPTPPPPDFHVLLAKWAGPYGGVPPFSQVKVEYFAPAFLAAMDQNRAELAAIASNPAAPTFENTIAALEDAGRPFANVVSIFGVYSSAMSDGAFQAVEREMAPKLAAFSDEIIQNTALFTRIESVYGSPEKAKLTPEQQRLVWQYHTRFVLAGAKLDAEAKAKVAAINQRLATLYTEFGQAVLGDEGSSVLLESEADLAGLPPSVRASAQAAADEKKVKALGLITNTRSSVEPFLTFSEKRDLRESVWRSFVKRGDNSDTRDTKARVSEILLLRAQRAKLLGFATHAHWRLVDKMAKTPERAMELLETVWKPAVARVREEVKDMQAVVKKEGGKFTIAPWDYRFYAEKVRKAKFDLDQNELKPYLQLEKLREALFFVAEELFGLSFRPADGVPVYHPDVKVWEVVKKDGGQHIGLWYFDPYARPGKRSGAWMNAYRNQERFRGAVSTIVSNNANFVKGKPGEPVLISWDDARTLFHEFGHALHGLASDVEYPALSGTSVPTDYVEFPSQLLEHWLDTKEVLTRFALHEKTGAPLPDALRERLEKSRKFNQGFATVEYLASALLDMKLHLLGEARVDPDAFERDTLKSLGMPAEMVMRHRLPHFSHVFGSDDYSAGYYSYLWADTITTDAFEAFLEAGGPYDHSVAERLRKFVFSVGNTVDPAEGYRTFRGRAPSTGALMRDRGFAPPAAPAKRK